MQRTIKLLLITTFTCIPLNAHSDTVALSPAQQLGQNLVDKKYVQLKTLYGSYNPFKKAWFKPATQEHLNKRLAVATAKGDTVLAAQISKLGYQNKIEQIVPHAAWKYRATILCAALLALAKSKSTNPSK